MVRPKAICGIQCAVFLERRKPQQKRFDGLSTVLRGVQTSIGNTVWGGVQKCYAPCISTCTCHSSHVLSLDTAQIEQCNMVRLWRRFQLKENPQTEMEKWDIQTNAQSPKECVCFAFLCTRMTLAQIEIRVWQFQPIAHENHVYAFEALLAWKRIAARFA